MPRNLEGAHPARKLTWTGRAVAVGLAALVAAASARGAQDRLELFPGSVPPSEYFRENAAVTRESGSSSMLRCRLPVWFAKRRKTGDERTGFAAFPARWLRF